LVFEMFASMIWYFSHHHYERWIEGVTLTQVLVDVVTQDTYHMERYGKDKEDDKKRKNVLFQSIT
jgi:hypothetical protein